MRRRVEVVRVLRGTNSAEVIRRLQAAGGDWLWQSDDGGLTWTRYKKTPKGKEENETSQLDSRRSRRRGRREVVAG